MSFVSLARELNMAKRLLLRSQAASEVPDIIGHADIHQQWDSILPDLDSQLQNEKCGPISTEILEYPKGPIAVRPLTRFSVRDHLVFDALTYRLAPTIDTNISCRVYSYRWNVNTGQLGFPIESWLQMRQHGVDAIHRNDATRIGAMDISAFYEHVDIATLVDDLHGVSEDGWTVNRLSEFLGNFQNINHAWGLPQGSDASGILANLYLAPVDEFLDMEGIDFVRYSDDIMIFHRDWNYLRDALSSVNRILRSRRLSASSSKTRIWEPSEGREFLDDTHKKALSYNIDIRAEGSREDLRRYFDKVTQAVPLSYRDLRFSINRLRIIGDDYGISWCLDNLRYIANMAPEVFKYFESTYGWRGRIAKSLSEFMRTGYSRSYPYLEQRVLRYFIDCDVQDRNMLDSAWGVLKDRNRVKFPREFAARYIGGYARASGSSQLLLHMLEEEQSADMRRAILIALYESGYCSERLLSRMKKAFPDLEWVCNYLLTGPRLPRARRDLWWL